MQSNEKFYVFDKKRQINGNHGKGFYFGDINYATSYYGDNYIACYLKITKLFDMYAEYDINEIKRIYSDYYHLVEDFIKKESEISYNGKIQGFVFYNYIGNINTLLISAGYDGIKHDFVYVVFEPNQIKLADGTNKTFNGRSDDIRESLNITERTEWNGYKVGDVISGDKLLELSGGNAYGKKDKKYILIQEPLSNYDYTRQDIYDNDEGYEKEQDEYIEKFKLNFLKTPPIPEEDDGLHRIVVAKELGYKTILMWKEITNESYVNSDGEYIEDDDKPSNTIIGQRYDAPYGFKCMNCDIETFMMMMDKWYSGDEYEYLADEGDWKLYTYKTELFSSDKKDLYWHTDNILKINSKDRIICTKEGAKIWDIKIRKSNLTAEQEMQIRFYEKDSKYYADRFIKLDYTKEGNPLIYLKTMDTKGVYKIEIYPDGTFKHIEE